MGLPPTPCFFARLRVTAERICAAVMRAAFALGTHFGYLRLRSALSLERPHFLKPPPFLRAPISTHSSSNHYFRPLAINDTCLHAFYTHAPTKLKHKQREKP